MVFTSREGLGKLLGITPNSPAHQTGLKEGNVIVSISQTVIKGVDDIHRHLVKEIISKRLEIVVLREWMARLALSKVPVENPD